MKGVVNILNSSGDTTLEWSTETEEQQDGKLSPEYVEREFDRLVRQGHLAFHTDADGKNEQITRFDPSIHERVTLSPLFVGG